MAPAAGGYEVGPGHFNRMQLALEIVAPEIEEFVQHGQARGEVVILPEVGLQQAGMVRQVVEDFGGDQAIIVELQVERIHSHIPSFALTDGR